MSMKRSRARAPSRGRRDDDTPINLGGKPAAAEKSWQELVGDQPDDAFVTYDMKATFAKGALLNHATFGKGVVVHSDSQRIEVLFAEGKKKLGHGLR